MNDLIILVALIIISIFLSIAVGYTSREKQAFTLFSAVFSILLLAILIKIIIFEKDKHMLNYIILLFFILLFFGSFLITVGIFGGVKKEESEEIKKFDNQSPKGKYGENTDPTVNGGHPFFFIDRSSKSK